MTSGRGRLQDLTTWLRGGPPPPPLDGTTSNASGTRAYRLYRPCRPSLVGARPLVVMLHGCRQDPDDFAAGTQMHARGHGRGCFVLYPGQDRRANPRGCWNWFEVANQQRDSGEAAILADMTRQIMTRERIDPRRVYVAGLSAGGAMAAILAATHPDLFAAVGIHSGLPHAAASNLSGALYVMKYGAGHHPRRAGEPPPAIPTIVFHGDQDATVHPRNGEDVIARTGHLPPATALAPTPATRIIRGVAPGGHGYTRTVHLAAAGRTDAEHWVIHGSGHAWSGGAAEASYTDPRGPDASREMLRFFREHPR
jgi:poly(hydroxyalkanoate) depolymerase family esterase